MGRLRMAIVGAVLAILSACAPPMTPEMRAVQLACDAGERQACEALVVAGL